MRHRGAELVRDEFTALDPAAHRAHRHIQERRHLGHGEESLPRVGWFAWGRTIGRDLVRHRRRLTAQGRRRVHQSPRLGLGAGARGAADPQLVDHLLDRQQAWRGLCAKFGGFLDRHVWTSWDFRPFCRSRLALAHVDTIDPELERFCHYLTRRRLRASRLAKASRLDERIDG